MVRSARPRRPNLVRLTRSRIDRNGQDSFQASLIRGHHLADPDQWHDLFSRTQARLCRSGSATLVPPTRPRFSLKGRGLTPIRASHPSGSRRWGCSAGSRHPAPGSSEPQKIVGAPPRSKWTTEAGAGRGRGSLSIQASPPRTHRAEGSQIAGLVPCRHRPTPCWLDGRGVSVTSVAP